MRYAVYRPRIRVREHTVVYALLGVSDVDDLPIPWTAGYRRAATVSASTAGEAALLGEALLGDILVPATGSAVLCARDERFVPRPRPPRRRA